MDADELWECSKPYAQAYNTLARGRGLALGYGISLALAIPYSEISRYWKDHAVDPNDLEEFELLVSLVQAQDKHYLDFTRKQKKK